MLIWRCAGILGIDPSDLTLRELLAMSEARERSEWTRASALMSLIANAHRDPRKGRAFKPTDFDPFARANTSHTAIRADVSVLKDMFINGRMPTETSS